MKKVVNVEIARQIFWIEEDAYAKLHTYLQKIGNQLAGQEMAAEIREDIELRVAELLYPHGTNQRSIQLEQVEATIEQIGYLEREDSEEFNKSGERVSPYIGGVCAVIANRYKFSGVLIRLLFIAASFLFGLGIFVYVLLWHLLRPKPHFGNVTAKEIATSSGSKKVPFLLSPLESTWEITRKIFTRKRLRWPFFIILAMLSIFAMSLGLEFLARAFFPPSLSIAICVCGVMCLAATWVISIQKLLLLDTKVNPAILLTLFIGTIGVVWGSIELNLAHAHSESQSFQYVIPKKGHYEITLVEPEEWGEPVNIEMVPLLQGQPYLEITYSADGKNSKDAKANLQSIDYQWSILDEKIVLNARHFRQSGSLSRRQKVFIQIYLPQGSSFQTTSELFIKEDSSHFGLTSLAAGLPQKYLVNSNGVIKLGPSHITEIDRHILRKLFCETFYMPSPKPFAKRIARPIEITDLKSIYTPKIDPVNQIRSLITSDFKKADLTVMMAQLSQMEPQPTQLLDFAQQLFIERDKAR